MKKIWNKFTAWLSGWPKSKESNIEVVKDDKGYKNRTKSKGLKPKKKKVKKQGNIKQELMKKKVGKRKRKGWRKRSPRCTLCTAIRWMGNIKGRHPMRELKQLQKEKYADLRVQV